MIIKAIEWGTNLLRPVLCLALLVTATPFGAAQAARTGLATADLMQIVIDEDQCARAWDANCDDLGANTTPPADGNSSPVLLVAQLTLPNGAPIIGLTEAEFSVRAFSTPVELRVAQCNSCFVETAVIGVYRMYLEPDPGFVGFWTSGTHLYQLRADLPRGTIRALFKVEVP